MPRQVRIEFPGATYHVMCRGNRGEVIFIDDGDREMMLATLAETVKRTGWEVHAWVWMNNHYHLLLQTPEPNLVRGMTWFQATYTARMAARHRLRGHLFGGRYKAVLVGSEPGDYFRTLLDYIHLNPVRAGVIRVARGDDLGAYRWSSWQGYIQPPFRQGWHHTDRAFRVWQQEDTVAGRTAVRRRLEARITHEAAEKCGLSEIGGQGLQSTLRRGWYYGDEAFRDGLLEKAATLLDRRRQPRQNYHGPEVTEHGEAEAERLLEAGLLAEGLARDDLPSLPKSDSRKVRIAIAIRSHTAIPLAWLASRLHMGTPSNVSHACRRHPYLPDLS